jgi:hypothetical protein
MLARRLASSQIMADTDQMYTAENHAADKARILKALDVILSVREECKDVMAIPRS